MDDSMIYRTLFLVFPILFMIVFLIVLSFFIINLFKLAKEKAYNDNQPKLTVDAKIVAKRDDINRHHSAGVNNMHHTQINTTYYATFQFDSGDRIELKIPRDKIGYLVEGDSGKLTFQGTRYFDFERQQSTV